jgi:hypothetical protein
MDVTFTNGEVRGARRGETAIQALPLPADLLSGADPAAPLFDQWMGIMKSQPVGDRLFVDAILDGVPPSPAFPTFYDGWRVQEVLEAALRSHHTGAWAAVADQDAPPT